jgi:isocitrate/isopropylmalate dehydrogenase
LRPSDEGRRRVKAPRRRKVNIAMLPGDGIGAEILDGPVAFLRQLERDGAPVRITGPWPYGTTGWAQTGSVLPEETIARTPRPR